MIAKRAMKLLPLLAVAAVLALVAGAVAAQSNGPSPFLGVHIADDPSGILVIDVLPDGPAAEAGVQVGDVITAVDGETASEAANMSALLADYAIGDNVELDILRGEETLTLTVTLADRADFDIPTQDEDDTTAPTERAFLGVSLQDVYTGISVREVVPGSPADEAGIQTDDIIVAVNGERLANSKDLVSTIQAMAPGDTITLDYTRDGEELSAEITLAANTSLPDRPGRFGLGRGDVMPFSFNMRGDEVIFYNAASGEWHIIHVSEDSPLYEAGLRDGDVVTAVDGEALAPDDVEAFVDELDDDAEVTLSIEREGEAQDLTVPASALETLTAPMFGMRGLGEMRDMGDLMPFTFGMPLPGFIGVRLGITYVDLNEETAAEHDVDVTEGALVNEVDEDSPAAEAGLQVGDIITAVDGDVIDEERTLRDRLFAYEPDDTVTLTVLRDGEELQLEATLTQPDVNIMRRFDREELLPFLEEHGLQLRGRLPNRIDLVPEGSPSV